MGYGKNTGSYCSPFEKMHEYSAKASHVVEFEGKPVALPKGEHMGRECVFGWMVVDEGLCSLALLGNPSMMVFPVGKWVSLDGPHVMGGKGDFGGIWIARTSAGAKRDRDYVLQNYGRLVRVFLAAASTNILWADDDRVKTDGVCLLKEML
ncbi:MAG TPA: hypothetical protein PLO51_02540 [Candidatus Micrarchaeota archaeon]|nr:hypothetical protein [Candidatus Micrarchaeota archaeon]